jgi:NHL repeat
MRKFSSIAVTLMVILASVVAVRPATADDTQVTYINEWGTLGSGDGQFNALSEIDVAGSGQVFTVENGDPRVQRFSGAGDFQTSWGSSAPGYGLADVAVSADMRVYVADANNHRIRWFTPEGELGGSWGSEGTGPGQFDVPADLAVAPGGSVYVADFNTGRIQRFTRDGAFVTSWGSQGSGAGQFEWITGISVGPDGTVYVVEQENHRVQRFEPGGALLGYWGVEGSGNGQFLSPTAIDVGSDGRVYVADKGRDDVQVFEPTGGYMGKFGSSGTGAGQFEIPTGIAVGANGSVYVADNNQERVQRFASIDPTADSDGDSLPDAWELLGYDSNGDGNVDVDLPAMGADPMHKDVFVEIDWMSNHHLDDAAIQKVVSAFAAAPAGGNPDGRTGIALHVDNGSDSIMTGNETWGDRSDSDQLTHRTPLGTGSSNYNWASFDTLKAGNFTAARRPIFHYVISIHGYDSTTSSGISRGIIGSDLIVSLGAFCAVGDCSGTTAEQAGTFMHELGHNLGLRHGGGDHVNRKPNFLSVMNYAFQLAGLVRDGKSGVFDYSKFPVAGQTLSDLNETSLKESAGLGGSGSILARYTTTWRCGSKWQTGSVVGAADLNCNGTQAETVGVDLNNDGAKTTLASWNDWSTIVFAGGAVGDVAGAPLPGQTPKIEPRKKVLLQTARVLSGDTKRPKVRVRGPKHRKVAIRARDNRALDRILLVVDGRTRQVPAANHKAKTYRLTVAHGKHRIRVCAVDAAGNASPVVKRSVRG